MEVAAGQNNIECVNRTNNGEIQFTIRRVPDICLRSASNPPTLFMGYGGTSAMANWSLKKMVKTNSPFTIYHSQLRVCPRPVYAFASSCYAAANWSQKKW